MICTMAVVMSSCKDKDSGEGTTAATTTAPETTAPVTGPETEANTDETEADTQGSASVFPEALENIAAIQIPDMDYTGWEFAGGMVDSVEMEEEDVQTVLTACGGLFNFIFGETGVVSMINGEGAFTGTYETLDDSYAMHLVFEGYEYYAVFTEIEETTVMVLSNPADSEIALYMIPIEG